MWAASDILIGQHLIIIAHFDEIAASGVLPGIAYEQPSNPSGFIVLRIELQRFVILPAGLVESACEDGVLVKLMIGKGHFRLFAQSAEHLVPYRINAVFPIHVISRVHSSLDQPEGRRIAGNDYGKRFAEIIHDADF